MPAPNYTVRATGLSPPVVRELTQQDCLRCENFSIFALWGQRRGGTYVNMVQVVFTCRIFGRGRQLEQISRVGRDAWWGEEFLWQTTHLVV